jgi:hypothetical protein
VMRQNGVQVQCMMCMAPTNNSRNHHGSLQHLQAGLWCATGKRGPQRGDRAEIDTGEGTAT